MLAVVLQLEVEPDQDQQVRPGVEDAAVDHPPDAEGDEDEGPVVAEAMEGRLVPLVQRQEQAQQDQEDARPEMPPPPGPQGRSVRGGDQVWVHLRDPLVEPEAASSIAGPTISRVQTRRGGSQGSMFRLDPRLRTASRAGRRQSANGAGG